MSDLTVGIVTKDRLDCLPLALQSLAFQTVLPQKIIIIDSGDAPITSSYLVRAFIDILSRKRIEVNVRREFIYNLFEARRRVIELSTTPLLMFLDDDTVLESNYVKKLLSKFEVGYNFIAGLNLLPNNEIGKTDFSSKIQKESDRSLGDNQLAYFEYEKDMLIKVDYCNVSGSILRFETEGQREGLVKELAKFKSSGLEDFVITYLLGNGVIYTSAKSWHLMNPSHRRKWKRDLDLWLRDKFKKNPKKVMEVLK